jgi:hypothetical protein
MPAVIRKGIDSHIGHFSTTPNPFHKTKYVVAGQGKVTAQGGLAVTTDDAVGGSSKVTAGGYAVHRTGDATSGHGSFVANAAAAGSDKVTAGG